jgi:hypothetical protein
MIENDVIYNCFIVFGDCFGQRKEEIIELRTALHASVYTFSQIN